MPRIVPLAALGAAVLLAAGCGGSGSDGEASADGGAPGGPESGAPEADLDAAAGITGATLQTSAGEIELELLPESAPETVLNFAELAEGERGENPETGKQEFYDGTVFHRVIEDFMVQGGDPTGTGTGGPGYTFGDEIDPELEFTEPGVLAMANSGPDTNGSQFFITTGETAHLNGAHTIFGRVASEEDLAVAEEIAGAETDADDRPVDDIVLESVQIHREG
ncbi:peptidylprolyl isomerase [Nocardiopsis coralliicola]